MHGFEWHGIDQALGWREGSPLPLELPPADWQALTTGDGGTRLRPPPVGTVYGTLLNHHAALAALGDAVHQPPYNAPPQAPVLYIKPRNTHLGHGGMVVVPAGVDELEIGATLGLVIARPACRVSEAEALACVGGYTVCNDISVPHASYYRPSLRFKCRDGFLPIGPCIVGARRVTDPDALAVEVSIDGRVVQRTGTAGMQRPAARLIAEVSEFMTLAAGDVLMLGVAAGAPRARAGQRVSIRIDGVGTLECQLVAEEEAVSASGRIEALHPAARRAQGSPVRHARVAYGGTVHSATEHRHGVLLGDGRVLAEDQVIWLPPVEAGTIVALGINYADHAKELAGELSAKEKTGRQEEPLAFLKGPNSLVGHRGVTRRPGGAAFMHYECELAVVIGRIAKKVSRADAMAHVAGYTVANDYAVRDYLENWYRPNLRVKNRDGCTALGPWLVDAADVADPHALNLRTTVNGRLRQSGNTRDLIHDIPALIEYLSSFMTLAPGDLILTGTPEGVVNVEPGDEVVCEIDGIGRLVNTIAADAAFGR